MTDTTTVEYALRGGVDALSAEDVTTLLCGHRVVTLPGVSPKVFSAVEGFATWEQWTQHLGEAQAHLLLLEGWLDWRIARNGRPQYTVFAHAPLLDGAPELAEVSENTDFTENVQMVFESGFSNLYRPGAAGHLRLESAEAHFALEDLRWGVTPPNGAASSLRHELLRDLRRCGLMRPADARDDQSFGDSWPWQSADAVLHERARYAWGSRLPRGFFGDLTRLQPRRDLALQGDYASLDASPQGSPSGKLRALQQVMSDRVSTRPSTHSATLGCSDVITLLDAALRKRVVEDEQGARIRGAYPSGGGFYGVETILIARDVEGMEPGVYGWDAFRGRLLRLADPSRSAVSILKNAARSMDSGIPQLALLFAADYRLYSAKYTGIAYTTILKEVGGMMESVYLVGAALDLAVCSVGSGDAAALRNALPGELHYLESVGEMVVGGRRG